MTKNYEVREIPVQELWTRYSKTGDIETRNELIRQYSYLVRCIAIKIVGRYQYFNYLDDIINEGLIALMDAIAKFDMMKNVKFETFASIKVRGAMIDYIRRQDCFPRRLKKMARAINEADETLNQRLGRSPTEQEIADYMKISLPEYEKMLAETSSMNILSFEELVYEKGVESIALHSASSTGGPEQVMAEKELSSMLQLDIENLEEKEKIVISLYYKEQLKIKEISGVMGISESRVSQIHSSALRKLRRSLENYLKQ
ncbi:RNA polymerase sigma factor FliA [Caprobacter fermentans]|uniref:FliA/WhiG family RNA polymerase sigma factor n=1 Tax=Caproicibacter fermentans TaxID=2576756 RepID=A0A6N8HVD5_9FIRM|nr:FliA/WhiG family RNA polymerase sigma factor [Caproicibacter fermentans]MVB09754.1 RNA polymerase sigma factor FliA [Caproicibacter fermentans]OCN03159.1 flagellar biosynthesis protein FliA [Clostridium sp. W14A]QNK42363.1 FliA/WhiG family RNA polymerase sigma factor [Caproicibacter fermentans]